MTQQPTRAGTVGAILRVTSGNFLEQFDFFLFGDVYKRQALTCANAICSRCTPPLSPLPRKRG